MKDTKKELLYHGIELFKEKGFDAVSINEICQTLNLTKGSFYHHYQSKDELLLTYYQIKLNDAASYIYELNQMEDTIEKIWKMLVISIDSSVELGSDLLKALIYTDLKHENKFFSPYSFFEIRNFVDYHRIVIDTIECCKKKKIIKDIIDTETTIFLFYSASSSILVRWSTSHGKIEWKKELQEVFDSLFT